MCLIKQQLAYTALYSKSQTHGKDKTFYVVLDLPIIYTRLLSQ